MPKGLAFETSLVYVQFPDFSKEEDNHFHDDVLKLFSWLKDQKVKTIRELRVPDNLYNPVPDEMIESMLSYFQIFSLDWRKMDMCFDVIRLSTRHVRKVHLYSSGNWAVLHHWAMSNFSELSEVCNFDNFHSSDNLIHLIQLRTVIITIVDDVSFTLSFFNSLLIKTIIASPIS
jgi:hypothetical protein